MGQRSGFSSEPRLPPSLASNGGAQREELQLTISRPTLLLNHMAERYTSTPRVLMEFVDNAIDDAEAFYRRVEQEGGNEAEEGEGDAGESFGAYEREVEVNVFVCEESKRIRVVDNCRGMPREVLQRVVLNVGESKKRGVAFLNGQYGFGMQAFRTCCESLTVNVMEETSEGNILSIHRCEPFDYAAQDLGVIESIDASVVWPAPGEEVSALEDPGGAQAPPARC